MRPANYVNGSFLPAGEGETFPLIDPVTGTASGEVPESSRATVDAAVTAARAALNGEWGRTSPEERAAALRRIADGIEARFGEFVDAETADTGKPRDLAATVD